MLCCLFCVCVACSSSRSPWLRGHVVQVHLSGDSQSCLTSSWIHSLYLFLKSTDIYLFLSSTFVEIVIFFFLLIYSWPSPFPEVFFFFFSFLFFTLFKRVIGFFDLQAIHVLIPIQTILKYFDFNLFFELWLFPSCFTRARCDHIWTREWSWREYSHWEAGDTPWRQLVNHKVATSYCKICRDSKIKSEVGW